MDIEYDCNVTVDLTPMIDCTFQLILFFMLTLKVAQDQLEPVVLPLAEQAQKDQTQDKKRMYINLPNKAAAGEAPKYQVWIDGVNVTPTIENGFWRVSGSELEKRLVKVAEIQKDGYSEREVQIRADAECPYEMVAMVMAALTAKNVRIYKIQLGAAMKDK